MMNRSAPCAAAWYGSASLALSKKARSAWKRCRSLARLAPERDISTLAAPPPPGGLYGCEKKGVAGKGIRKNMKTKGPPRRAGAKLSLPQTQRNLKHAGGDTVVTGSM